MSAGVHGEIPHSTCWIPNAEDEDACTDLDGKWEAGDVNACILKDGGEADDCEYQWDVCEYLDDANQCGISGAWDNSVLQHYLFCGVNAYAECKTEEACLAAGECVNRFHNWGPSISDMSNVYYNGSKKYRANVCVAPRMENSDYGWMDYRDCEAYREEDYPENLNLPIDAWDTSNVTDMSEMFEGASTFNQPINHLNTSSDLPDTTSTHTTSTTTANTNMDDGVKELGEEGCALLKIESLEECDEIEGGVWTR